MFWTRAVPCDGASVTIAVVLEALGNIAKPCGDGVMRMRDEPRKSNMMLPKHKKRHVSCNTQESSCYRSCVACPSGTGLPARATSPTLLSQVVFNSFCSPDVCVAMLGSIKELE